MNRKIERFFDEYDEIGHRLSMAHERDFARSQNMVRLPG